MDRRTATVGLLTFMVSGCGGAGSSGAGSVFAPAPTPTSSPTSTPSPTPPTYRAATTAPLTAQFRFYPSDAYYVDSGAPYGTRDGFIGPNRMPFQTGTNGNATGTETEWKFAAGINQQTSQYFVVHGRPSARALTPVSSLLVRHTDAAKLKRQLGITGSLFALTTDPDLDLYEAQAELASGDPTRVADAERFVAAILRVQALDVAASSFLSPDHFLRLGGRLNAASDAFVFTNERMATFLAASPRWQNARADVVSGAAHLINAFVAAIGVSAGVERAARYSLASAGYLALELDRLARVNTAEVAAAALAVTAPQIESETARYADRLLPTSTGFFFPGPDFYRLAGGGASVIRYAESGMSQFFLDGAVVEMMGSNDLVATSTGSVGFGNTGTLETVTLPAQNAAQIAITRDAANITVTPLGNFRGLTYFDYTSRNDLGELQMARVYLRVV